MCGIAVALAWDGAADLVHRLLAAMAHRGDITDPVACPFRNTAMGTRRLRIVDGAHALQPQLSHDQRMLVVFNGEIYNHPELRRELEAAGVRFRTQSDTEVLACALSHWGPAALSRLNGMYAFVALDLRNRTFLAARDPFGVKPLYFLLSDTGIVFCSEIRPLLTHVARGDVHLLPPGHMMTATSIVRSGSLPPDQGSSRKTAQDTETLDSLLAAAVRSRIPADLPFALMVSGGIDSTLVAHYAHRERPDAIGYFLGDENAPDFPYVETYARQSGLEVRHVATDIALADPMSLIERVVETVESFEPDIVRNSLCTFLLARQIHADGYRIAFSGEGADELFAGYPLLEEAFRHGDDVGSIVRDQHIASMHRNALQRIDRCGMRFQLEIREPFLDPNVAAHALGLEGAALVARAGGDVRGKQPLRRLFDLHPALPEAIRDRQKLPLNRGAGLDETGHVSMWSRLAEDAMSDARFREGSARFAAFDLASKEELIYLSILADCMDVSRVPHFLERKRLWAPSRRAEER